MRKKGFTLIELMIVIAMIGIIVAITLPRLDPFVSGRRLKSAARLIAGAISLAYGEAIAKNVTYRLYLEPSTGRYWITEVRVLEEEGEKSTAAIGIRLGTQFELREYTDGAENIEETLPSEPMFAPKKLPQGIHFSSVEVRRDFVTVSSGAQYIEFNPLGRASPANINLENDEGEGFGIIYDGVTGIPVLVPSSGGP